MYGSYNSYNFCNPCCYFSRIGASVSRWCSDGCNDHHDDCCCMMPRYAYLTQTDAFTIEAGSPVPFTGANVLGDTFELTDGELVIPGPGVYHVRYHVQIPSGAPVNTSFVIRVDGIDIAGTQRTVVTAPNGATNVTAEAVIEICDTAVLGLYSTAALTMPVSTTGDSLATLTVVGL